MGLNLLPVEDADMKKITLLLTAALAALPLLLTACGGSRYLVVTDNYTTYVSDSKPKTSDDGASVTFDDERAGEVTLPFGSIKEVRKLD